MNTIRLSTFSLAIVLFAIGALILPVSTASAHCKGNHKKDPECDEPHDPTGDPSAIVYTVKLTGAFEFEQDMTLNSKANQLRSEDDVKLELVRPGGKLIPDDQTVCGRTDDMESTNDMCLLWNDVFSKCRLFFEPTPVKVPGFTAPAGRKGWTIDKPGGVRVNFRNIRFVKVDFDGFLIPDSAWVNLALIGDIDFDVAFPPVGGIDLKYFQIYGQTEAGVTPRLACDDKNFETEVLREPIRLTITGPPPPEQP